jgi:hypothetical protein
MGRWGWRLGVITTFVSVWVAGCNLVGDLASTTTAATPYPEVTLTVGRIAARASPPPSPIVQTEPANDDPPAFALTLAGTPFPLDFYTPTAVPLRVEPPQCAAESGGIVCLGRVINPLGYAVERVMVEVRLLRPNGDTPLLEQVAVEQILIPPGGVAPYRARFDMPWDSFVGATAALQSADPNPADSPYLALPVEDQRLELADGSATISGVIVNPFPEDVELLRAVVTLHNADDDLSAYRVIDLEQERLASGGGAMLQVTISTEGSAGDTLPRATMYVEARRAGG